MADQNQKQPTPASEWRDANKRLVELPSGRAVRIRRLSAEFFIKLAELPAAPSVPPGTPPPAPDPGWRLAFQEMLVVESCEAPRVVPRAQEPGEAELHARDFGPDLDPLIGAILEYNPELIAPPFRPEAGGADPAPDGGSVRGATEPAAPGDAPGPAPGPERAPAGPGGGAPAPG